MLDPQDIRQISQIIEKLDRGLKEEIKQSEDRLRKEFSQELKIQLERTERNIIKEVGEVVDHSIFPQLEEKANKADAERLDNKTDSINKRVNDLENLPTIAHELKKKK